MCCPPLLVFAMEGMCVYPLCNCAISKQIMVEDASALIFIVYNQTYFQHWCMMYNKMSDLMEIVIILQLSGKGYDFSGYLVTVSPFLKLDVPHEAAQRPGHRQRPRREREGVPCVVRDVFLSAIVFK